MHLSPHNAPHVGTSPSSIAVLAVAVFLAFLCSLPVAAQNEPRMIDVALKYGTADYVDTGNTQVIPVRTATYSPQNLQSFVIGYKAWNLVGEFVYKPTFYYEIDRQRLIGKSKRVEYYLIQKYPDLVKRYKAIRPTRVSFEIILDLWVKTPDGRRSQTRGYFNVKHNDLVYFESGSGRNYSSPTSPMRWKDSFSTWSVYRFTDRDQSDEKRLKELLRNLDSVTSGHPDNLYLRIDWPEEAIDQIAVDYERYEKENKELGKELKEIKEEPKEQKKIDPNAMSGDMAKPFEDIPKTAEAFSESGTVGLKSKGKVVFESAELYRPDKLDANGGLFSFGTKGGDRYVRQQIVVNAAGKRLTVDGHSQFIDVRKGDVEGTYRVAVLEGGSEIYTSKKIYSGVPYLMTQDQFARFQRHDQGPSPPPKPSNCTNCVSLVAPHDFKVFSEARIYVVDSKFRVIRSEPAVCHTRDIDTQIGRSYDWAGEYRN